MIRNLKILGLAIVAIFAMSAVIASGASAQGKLTSDGPVTLIGTPTGLGGISFRAFGGSTQCSNLQYTGHKVNVTPHERIPNGATEITITPHYGACNTSLVFNFPTTVDMNGCDYVFYLEETTFAADKYGVGFSIVCPVGKHIQLTLFTAGTGSKHESKNQFCTFTITEGAEILSGIEARDTTNNEIDLSGPILGMEIHKKTTTSDKSEFLCKQETTGVAEFNIDVTVKGVNSLGESTAIGLSD